MVAGALMRRSDTPDGQTDTTSKGSRSGRRLLGTPPTQRWPGPGRGDHGAGPSLSCMRAVQITRFGGPEVLDVVDVPEPQAGEGQKRYDVSTAGINLADTHHVLF